MSYRIYVSSDIDERNYQCLGNNELIKNILYYSSLIIGGASLSYVMKNIQIVKSA